MTDFDTLTGRRALKNPTIDETREAQDEDGKALVKLTRAEREAAKQPPKTKSTPPNRALESKEAAKPKLRGQFEPPYSYIQTGCYTAPKLTKKEAFYAAPEGLRGRLILA